MRLPIRIGLVAALSIVGACTAKSDGPASSSTPDCDEARRVGSSCAGLTVKSCQGDECFTGVSCSATKNAASDGDLASALAGAGAGSCLSLAAGTYGEVKLPAGVSLIGHGAGTVTVAKVEVGGGKGTVMRGVTASGVHIGEGASDVVIEDVAIKASEDAGVTVGAGASVRIARSEITGSAKQGIYALDAASVSVDGTWIQGSKGPGLWAECSGDCGCSGGAGNVALTNVIVRENGVVGLSFVGVKATLDGVDVRDHGVGANFRGAGGIAASKCASVTAVRTRVLDSAAFGVLFDHATGSFGGSDATAGVEIARNQLGLWVQNTEANGSQPFVVENGNIHDNAGVGVGVGANSGSVTVRTSEVASTRSVVVPVLTAGVPAAREVGDGITWGANALMRIEGVHLRSNARASILVDGPVAQGSAILRTSLEGGDESKGVVVQHYPAGGTVFEHDQQLPAPQFEAGEILAFPAPPQLPAPQ